MQDKDAASFAELHRMAQTLMDICGECGDKVTMREIDLHLDKDESSLIHFALAVITDMKVIPPQAVPALVGLTRKMLISCAEQGDEVARKFCDRLGYNYAARTYLH